MSLSIRRARTSLPHAAAAGATPAPAKKKKKVQLKGGLDWRWSTSRSAGRQMRVVDMRTCDSARSSSVVVRMAVRRCCMAEDSWRRASSCRLCPAPVPPRRRKSTPPIEKAKAIPLLPAEERHLGEGARARRSAEGPGRHRRAVGRADGAGRATRCSPPARTRRTSGSPGHRVPEEGRPRRHVRAGHAVPGLPAAPRRRRSSRGSCARTPNARSRMHEDQGRRHGLLRLHRQPAATATATAARSTACSGVWAAAQAGVEVPTTYWKIVEKALDRATRTPTAAGRTSAQDASTRSPPA